MTRGGGTIGYPTDEGGYGLSSNPPSGRSGRPESNRRRPAWEAGILSLNYARIWLGIQAPAGGPEIRPSPPGAILAGPLPPLRLGAEGVVGERRIRPA